MSQFDELLDLEREGWKALSTSSDSAVAFYGSVLADRVLMLLPGGLLIDDRQEAVTAMAGPPWDDVELSDERVLPLEPDAAVVSYRATAHRSGGDYTALFNSTYVRADGSWRLALHQQTPV